MTGESAAMASLPKTIDTSKEIEANHAFLSGVYREVIPQRKLVYTWAWKSTPERESLVTVELRAAGGGTDLTLTHEQFYDEEARDRHEHGWTGCLGRLERYLG